MKTFILLALLSLSIGCNIALWYDSDINQEKLTQQELNCLQKQVSLDSLQASTNTLTSDFEALNLTFKTTYDIKCHQDTLISKIVPLMAKYGHDRCKLRTELLTLFDYEQNNPTSSY